MKEQVILGLLLTLATVEAFKISADRVKGVGFYKYYILDVQVSNTSSNGSIGVSDENSSLSAISRTLIYEDPIEASDNVSETNSSGGSGNVSETNSSKSTANASETNASNSTENMSHRRAPASLERRIGKAKLAELFLYSIAGEQYKDLNAELIAVDRVSNEARVADETADCTGGNASVAVAVDGTRNNSFACWDTASQSGERIMLRISHAGEGAAEFAVMGYAFVLAGYEGCPLKWTLYGTHENSTQDEWTELDKEDWTSNASRRNLSDEYGYCQRYPLPGHYAGSKYGNCLRKKINSQYALDMQPVAKYPGTAEPCIEDGEFVEVTDV